VLKNERNEAKKLKSEQKKAGKAAQDTYVCAKIDLLMTSSPVHHHLSTAQKAHFSF